MPLFTQPGLGNRRSIKGTNLGKVFSQDLGANVIHEGPHVTRGPLAQPQSSRGGSALKTTQPGRARGTYEGIPGDGVSAEGIV